MAIVNVQGKRGTGTSGPLSITMDATPIAGNVLIAVIGMYKSGNTRTVSSITQTNVAWSLACRPAGCIPNTEIWYGIVSANPSATLSIAYNSTIDATVADVYEYSGLDTAALLDQTKTTTGGTGTNLVTGTTATTTFDVELCIGGNSIIGNISQDTPKNAFTLYDGAKYSTLMSVAFLQKIVAAKAAYSSGTTASASGDWTGCIATFKGLTFNSYSHTFNEKLGMNDSKSRFKTMAHTFLEKLGVKDTPKWVLSGLAKDASGNLLVGAVVLLYKASNNAYVDYTYSDANGVYAFSDLDHATQYFVVAFKPGAPDIQGCTDKGITAGVFNNS